MCELVWKQQDCSFRVVLNIFFKIYLFLLLRAVPKAYRGSQARGLIGATATPQPQQRRIRAASATYTISQGNAGSLTHWARPRIEPETSWFLVRFVNHCASTGTPYNCDFLSIISLYKGKPGVEGQIRLMMTLFISRCTQLTWTPPFVLGCTAERLPSRFSILRHLRGFMVSQPLVKVHFVWLCKSTMTSSAWSGFSIVPIALHRGTDAC